MSSQPVIEEFFDDSMGRTQGRRANNALFFYQKWRSALRPSTAVMSAMFMA